MSAVLCEVAFCDTVELLIDITDSFPDLVFKFLEENPRPDETSFLRSYGVCGIAITLSYEMMNSNSAGFDAILRDIRGIFISAKATPNTSLPPIIADAIYDKRHDISEFGDIILNIRRLLGTHGKYSVHVIRRQANRATQLRGTLVIYLVLKFLI
ncbi:hypothetical protein Ccrd_024574 [Cynara cardunculus var. scolymus]|uniref:RNase H type-1 domain-containing protein n=1 Tax=Cynara cardunculus var. scolymus TaxID=59895 RepID=A0A103XC81_CYNCS|nr:hypothetical protein Ccrd_024574 [Cynara cardunculus var. scolymus]